MTNKYMYEDDTPESGGISGSSPKTVTVAPHSGSIISNGIESRNDITLFIYYFSPLVDLDSSQCAKKYSAYLNSVKPRDFNRP